MKCWYKVSSPFLATPVLLPNWSLPKIDIEERCIWQFRASSIFEPNWLSNLERSLKPVVNVMVFYRNPGSSINVAHVDLSAKRSDGTYGMRTCALNWVIGGSNSTMRWYEMPQGPIKTKLNSAGTAYGAWNIVDVPEVDRTNIRDMTLVRTDVPHAIFNEGDEGRWCLSLRFNSPSWDETVEQYKDLLELR